MSVWNNTVTISGIKGVLLASTNIYKLSQSDDVIASTAKIPLHAMFPHPCPPHSKCLFYWLGGDNVRFKYGCALQTGDE